MNRRVRPWRHAARQPGWELLGVGLVVLGVVTTAPAALGLASPPALNLASLAGVGHPAHQQTGVEPGHAECPPEAAAQPGMGAPPAGAPAPALVEPPVLSSRDGMLQATLTVAEQNVPAGDQTILGRVYNNAFVGPTLRVRPGDQVDLTLANCLDETSNLHFHGMHVTPTKFGDDIFRTVDPGQAAGYHLRIPPNHPTGTYWYHSHQHGRSNSQVFGGLSGLIVVEGLRDLLPPELRDVPEQTIALKDLQVRNGAIERDDIRNAAPTTRTVNGRLQPRIEIQPGETQLWRIANIGADVWYRLKLDGHTFSVLAIDGNPVWQVTEQAELFIPSGQRYDVLVQGGPPGEYSLETLPIDMGPDGPQYPQASLATLVAQGTSQPAATLPTTLAPRDDFGAVAIARRRQIVFSEDKESDKYYIDGRTFDHNRVDTTAQLGTVEEWTIRNDSQEVHSFHIHQGAFQVMSVNGVPYQAPGWQDTVSLPMGQEVVIRKPFRDFTGTFVYHCHVLSHEDKGMMAVIEVVP